MSEDAKLVEREARRRLVSGIGGDRLSSQEIAARLAAGGPAPQGAVAAQEARLFPVLHRLEADGKLRAGWQADTAGKVRRRYRIR